jgi:hypothetical protein
MMTEEVPKQCVFIDKAGGGTSSIPPPPVIPSNTNSTRANSRRNRVFVYRDFLLSTFPQLTTSCKNVLDVAGGRGDLSWLLHNIDGINSIIVDPRLPNHKSLIKSTMFLLDRPEEAAVRAVEGLPTHQPLATLLPRFMDRCDGNLSSPLHLRMHVDNNLVEALIKVCCNTHSKEEEEDKIMIWNEYWQKEKHRIESNKTVYGGTAPQTKTQQNNNNQDGASPSNRPQQITDARTALDIFKSLDYISGFHPDQATEATIDLALFLKVPFSIVPCCVFPSEFPNRQLDGMKVKSHSQLIDYLCMKHEKIRKGTLQFVDDERGTAKNVVLYMLKEDYD